LAERWKDGSAPGRPVAIVDGVGEFVSTEADQPLQALLRVCRANEIFVIADGETSDLQGSWPLLSMLKASRTGIALTPDQSDGDMIFRTAFPRVARADWPVGRGLFVRQGRVARVQVAMSSD
jgi:S-DNA-T family DNA segregation ATPase FtsK/SpoIIIE